MNADDDDFTEPTTGYWQRLADTDAVRPGPPWRHGYPVALPDGRRLVLPIRRNPAAPDRAVASLIPNQASFPVVRALAAGMADLARPFGAEAVVGMPTLGLAFAPLVAEALGFDRFVPLGYSRKYWYRDELSRPVASLTSPGAEKQVYLDPNQLPLVAGRRVVVIDDTVSSGRTAAVVLELLAAVGAIPCGLVVAMKQGVAWRGSLADGPLPPERIVALFATPHLTRTVEGWVPVPGTLAECP